jgi:signal transduction histidine kinase
VSVPGEVQRELVSITSEAVTNAVKHANATEIVVELRFPLQPDEPLLLSIRDNGPMRQQVEPRPGHLGLHFMQVSADAIGATLEWLMQAAGGTEVRVVAPTKGLPKQEEDTALDEWWSGKQLAEDEGGVVSADEVAAQPALVR